MGEKLPSCFPHHLLSLREIFPFLENKASCGRKRTSEPWGAKEENLSWVLALPSSLAYRSRFPKLFNEEFPQRLKKGGKFYNFTTDQNFTSFLLQEHVEWQKIESEFSVEAKSGTRSLLLHGLTFTTVACHSLFVWGDALLYRYSYYPLPSGFLGIIYSAYWGTFTRLRKVQFMSNEGMSNYPRLYILEGRFLLSCNFTPICT